MAEAIHYRFTVRGGSSAALEGRNEVPLARELVVATDTGLMKLGDGLTRYNDLPPIGGSSGSGWLRGEGAPVEETGEEGDFYLDDLTSVVYAKADAGWEPVGSLSGGGGGSGVREIVAGVNVAVDATDPARPVVSASGEPGPPGPPGPAGPRGGGIIPGDVRSLLRFDTGYGGPIGDAVGRLDWQRVGPASIDPGDSRFGGASLLFPSVNVQVRTADAAAPVISARGDFTAEVWVNRSGSSRNAVFSHRSSGVTASNGWYFSVLGDGSLQLVLGVGSFQVLSSAASGLVPPGQWVHLAVVKEGGTVRVYAGGVQRISGVISGALEDGPGAQFVLGAESAVGAPTDRSFLGRMDEFRYSSVARYTTNFTPPDAPFDFPVAPQLPDYTLASLPDPLMNRFVLIYVTDLAGGPEPCVSDGTAWRRLSDRSVAN